MIKIFGHPVSQPTRAVTWTLRMRNIPFEFKQLDPVAGETHTPEFLNKFPLGFVPALEEANGFCLQESGAILYYLAQKHNWDNVNDAKQSAKILEYMNWHNTSIRENTVEIFRPFMLSAILKKFPVPTLDAKKAKRITRHWKLLDSFLARTGYVAGTREPTVADFQCYAEFDQLLELRAIAPEPFAGLPQLSELKSLSAWLAAMQALPYHDEERAGLKRIVSYIAHQLKKSKL